MRTIRAVADQVGIDLNRKLDTSLCEMILDNKFTFVLRYIGRKQLGLRDLDAGEVACIVNAGLGLMPVQHVESERSWIPSAQKGTDYGRAAVEQCKELGITPGTSVWLDLEGVDVVVPPSVIIAYCNHWHTEVLLGGFKPGLYIGWHCGLNRHDLYYRLAFEHYWAAYNLNADETPLVRGVQMKQKTAITTLAVLGTEYDRDYINADALGGLPYLMVSGE